jgi:hypothetical protein
MEHPDAISANRTAAVKYLGDKEIEHIRVARRTESTIAGGERAIFARASVYDLTIMFDRGRGGEMAYAEDLKSSGAKAPCGFESRPRHQFSLITMRSL